MASRDVGSSLGVVGNTATTRPGKWDVSAAWLYATFGAQCGTCRA